MTPPHVLAHIAELQRVRELYEGASPRQRLSVALQRINNPTAYPNELVTRVSAVEAFARSLVANFGAPGREAVLIKHRKLATRDAANLVLSYMKLLGTTPSAALGVEIWEFFRMAVNARNLLVHECTYLDAQKYLPMENACAEVLFGLARLAKVRLPASAA